MQEDVFSSFSKTWPFYVSRYTMHTYRAGFMALWGALEEMFCFLFASLKRDCHLMEWRGENKIGLLTCLDGEFVAAVERFG